MKIDLPLEEMSVADKIAAMEALWSDLSKTVPGYSPPEWHDKILKQRARLEKSGAITFTDWEQAKKQIEDRIS